MNIATEHGFMTLQDVYNMKACTIRVKKSYTHITHTKEISVTKDEILTITNYYTDKGYRSVTRVEICNDEGIIFEIDQGQLVKYFDRVFTKINKVKL